MLLQYKSGKTLEARGFNSLSDPVAVMLLGPEYVFSADHGTRAAVMGHEISGPGYKAGGLQVGGRVENWEGGTLQIKAANVVWPRSSIRARYGVMYRARGGVESGDELICCYDFGDNISSMNGPFTVEWANGVVREY